MFLHYRQLRRTQCIINQVLCSKYQAYDLFMQPEIDYILIIALYFYIALYITYFFSFTSFRKLYKVNSFFGALQSKNGMVKMIHLFVNMHSIKILIKFCQYFGRFHKYFGYVDQSFGRFWAFHLVGDILIHQYIDILTNRFTECQIILKRSINSIISQIDPCISSDK